MRYGLPSQRPPASVLTPVLAEVEVYRKWRVVAVNLNRSRQVTTLTRPNVSRSCVSNALTISVQASLVHRDGHL